MIGGLSSEFLAPLVPVWVIALWLIFRESGARISPRWRDVLIVSAFVPAAAIFFWLPLFVSGYSMPKGGGDMVAEYFPYYRLASETLKSGVFPLWNPYLFAGSPFFADVESSLLYPVNLVYLVLVPSLTYQNLLLLLMVHYVVAAAGMYALVRGYGLTRLAAFAGGLVFAFSGFNVARFGHANILIGAVWLPLIVLYLDKMIVRRRLLSAVCAGVLYGLVLLGSHPQVAAYFALFFVLYVFVRTRMLAGEQGFRLRAGILPPPSILGLAAFAAVVAAALGAVQLLPGLELAARSVRVSDFSFEESSALALEPLGFVTFLVPHFFGNSATEHWGLKTGLVETYGYAGISTLVLALIAITCRRTRRGLVLLFGGVTLFFGLLSLGENTILYVLTSRIVPGLSYLRSSGRFLMFVDLGLAMLAAIALESMTRPLPAMWRKPFSRVLLLLGAVLLVVVLLLVPLFYYALLTSQDKDPVIFQRVSTAIESLNMSALFLGLTLALMVGYRYVRRRSAAFAVMFVVIIALDLFTANASFNVTREDLAHTYAPNAVTDFLTPQKEEFRIDTTTGIGDMWEPNAAMIHRLPDVMGLDKALVLSRFRRYWENLGSRSVPGYDLLGAKYLVARKDVQLDWGKFSLANSDHPQLNVYRNTRVYPRAMLVPTAKSVQDEEALKRVRRSDFDPTRVVLLEGPAENRSEQMTESGQVGEVLAVQYPTPNEVLIRFRANRPSYLLLNDVMYSGWRGYVDGKEVPVLRANYLFRAMAAPAGEHVSRFAFQPQSWRLGIALSLLGVGMVSGLAVLIILARARTIPSSERT